MTNKVVGNLLAVFKKVDILIEPIEISNYSR